jgi:hypothetical protein
VVLAAINPRKKRKTNARVATKMARVSVTPFECDESKFDYSEFLIQVRGQELGINLLKVSEWAANRTRYLKEGRHPEAASAQRVYRETYSLGSEEAALHEPDQVAGGGYTIKSRGPRRINSSIGSQWKSRVGEIDAAVSRISTEQRQNLMMNVKLSVTKK